MNTLDQKMMLIKTLDPDAHINFSQYTQRWYVSSNIEVTDGMMITSLSEHSDTPGEAIVNYLLAMQLVKEPKRLVTNSMRENRREWRWNGVAWGEV